MNHCTANVQTITKLGNDSSLYGKLIGYLDLYDAKFKILLCMKKFLSVNIYHNVLSIKSLRYQ